jgi:hypothetical protein
MGAGPHTTNMIPLYNHGGSTTSLTANGGITVPAGLGSITATDGYTVYQEDADSVFTANDNTLSTLPNGFYMTAGTFNVLGSTGAEIDGDFSASDGTVNIGSTTAISNFYIGGATTTFKLKGNATLCLAVNASNCSLVTAPLISIGQGGGNNTSLRTSVVNAVPCNTKDKFFHASTNIAGSFNTDSKIGYSSLDTTSSGTKWDLVG